MAVFVQFCGWLKFSKRLRLRRGRLRRGARCARLKTQQHRTANSAVDHATSPLLLCFACFALATFRKFGSVCAVAGRSIGSHCFYMHRCFGDFANVGNVLRLCWCFASEERECVFGELFSFAVVGKCKVPMQSFRAGHGSLRGLVPAGVSLRSTTCSRRIDFAWLHKKLSSVFGCGDNHIALALRLWWTSSSCVVLWWASSSCVVLWWGASFFVVVPGGELRSLLCAPFGGLLLPRCVVGSSLCGCGLLRLRVGFCCFRVCMGLPVFLNAMHQHREPSQNAIRGAPRAYGKGPVEKDHPKQHPREPRITFYFEI